MWREFNYSSHLNLPKYYNIQRSFNWLLNVQIVSCHRKWSALLTAVPCEGCPSVLSAKPCSNMAVMQLPSIFSFHTPHWPLHKPNLGLFLLLPPLTPDLPYAHGRGWVLLGQVSGRPFSADACPPAPSGLCSGSAFPILWSPTAGPTRRFNSADPTKGSSRWTVLNTESLNVTWSTVRSLPGPVTGQEPSQRDITLCCSCKGLASKSRDWVSVFSLGLALKFTLNLSHH